MRLMIGAYPCRGIPLRKEMVWEPGQAESHYTTTDSSPGRTTGSKVGGSHHAVREVSARSLGRLWVKKEPISQRGIRSPQCVLYVLPSDGTVSSDRDRDRP